MPNSLDVYLRNETYCQSVWAFVTGLAIQNNNARVLLRANGRDLYYPKSPSGIGQPLAEDCAIPLGPPGSAVCVHIPMMAGGRIWFSCDKKLVFLLNPGGPGGAALVEPSVLNPSDPNADTNFAFCEFTFNPDQLFANITYVDYVSAIPVALTLQTTAGAVQHVSGMPADGLDRVCTALRAQALRDGMPWDRLVVQKKGCAPLRVLSPTHGDAVGAAFAGYFEPYVDRVWKQYSGPAAAPSSRALRVNTQAAPGVLHGLVDERGRLMFGDEAFARPSTADIMGCNSGPFTTGPSPTRNALIPRLAAAFQRGGLTDTANHPADPSCFYKASPTNHYSRVVHDANLDGKGYAFAYDDVQPDGGADQSGKVNAGDPKAFIVAVGGRWAYAGDRMPTT